ncbi:MAG TPA: hypothetical protein VLF43_04550 [Candidatus Saccharimonadales bacterium]|nr:hypothetical protein [Candidatus Saccharimonadales bacterium]
MSETPTSIKLPSSSTTLFFAGNGALTPTELQASGVLAVRGSRRSETSQRIQTTGMIDGRLAMQVLAKDRLGNFQFSTHFLEKTGKLAQSGVRPKSPPETLDPISASLFMQTLIKTILDRQ